MGVAGFECRSHSMYPEVKRMIIKEKYFLKDLIYCTILSTFCTVFFVCSFFKIRSWEKNQILNLSFQGSANCGPLAVFIVILENSRAHWFRDYLL